MEKGEALYTALSSLVEGWDESVCVFGERVLALDEGL